MHQERRNTTLLVEPDAGGRLSGGYLYNRQMAEHGAWDLLSVSGCDLESALQHVQHPLVLADSIWLTPEHAPHFLRLQTRGHRVGVLLHSLPSMIAAAESGQGPRTEASQFERETLSALGLVGVLGPYFPRVLGALSLTMVTLVPGVHAAWRLAPRGPRTPRHVISVGAVTPRKGFLDLATVFSQLGREAPEVSWTWSVVGSVDVDPAYAQRVQACVAPEVAQGQVRFLGQLPTEQVRDAVQASDVLVMPSYDENHPLVLLEATAASVPCVAYPAGAAAELLGHGAAGTLVPIGDTAQLGSTLRTLLTNDATWERLTHGAWSIQAAVPDWAEAARRARSALSKL